MEKPSIIVFPSRLSGKVNAPAGKSMMQRALALALLNNGITKIYNPGKSDDDMHVLSIIESLGAKVNRLTEPWVVTSTGKLTEIDAVFCGESGLALRMFVPILALGKNQVMLNGKGTLIEREHRFPFNVFSQLNIQMDEKNLKLPITVKGPIQPSSFSIEANESSQFLTGLLIALGSSIQERINIEINNLVSSPYIELTLDVMKQFGYSFERENNKNITLHPRTKDIKNPVITIEGDWSGAVFLFLAGALTGNLSISGLNLDSLQADRRFLDALKLSGTKVDYVNGVFLIERQDQINPFDFDATDCPDLFPALSVLASYATGISRIKGVYRLFNKESNRAEVLIENLTQLGVKLYQKENELHIEGNGKLNGGEIFSHNDHRIAMAMACAGLRSSSPVRIFNPECINKSYPQFFAHINKLGASIQTNNYNFQS
jgi:3-phosphoshikimate 1-carboxyvinyltransferase